MVDNSSIQQDSNEKDNSKQGYRCQYCGSKMSKYDFETFGGICGKCRDILDWKDILKQMKQSES